MTTIRNATRLLIAAAALAAALPTATAAAETTEAGVLRCEAVEGSRMNLLIRSTVDVVCTFERKDGVREAYRGETGIELGLDLTFRSNEQFAFTVLATRDAEAGDHALTGKYVGASATVIAGVGLGAAVLVGGSNNSFGLQPLAIETNQGIGVAGGIGFLYIEPML